MRVFAAFLVGLSLCSALPAEAQLARGLSTSDLAQLGVDVNDVRLTNQEGQVIRWGDLNQRPRLVFFGFTHCPAVCPTTLSLLDNALHGIGPDAANVKIDFVSVDPARDTPAVLHDYLASFPGAARGYTVDGVSLTRLTRAYRAAFQRRPRPGGDYTMEHTTLIYVLNAGGAVIDAFAFDTPRDVVIQRLRNALISTRR